MWYVRRRGCSRALPRASPGCSAAQAVGVGSKLPTPHGHPEKAGRRNFPARGGICLVICTILPPCPNSTPGFESKWSHSRGAPFPSVREKYLPVLVARDRSPPPDLRCALNWSNQMQVHTQLPRTPGKQYATRGYNHTTHCPRRRQGGNLHREADVDRAMVLAVSPINSLALCARARPQISLYSRSRAFWYSQQVP